MSVSTMIKRKISSFLIVSFMILGLIWMTIPTTAQDAPGTTFNNPIHVGIGSHAGQLNNSFLEIYYSLTIDEGKLYTITLGFDEINDFGMLFYDADNTYLGYSSYSYPASFEFIADYSGEIIINVYINYGDGPFTLDIHEQNFNSNPVSFSFADNLDVGDYASWVVSMEGNSSLIDVPFSNSSSILMDVLDGQMTTYDFNAVASGTKNLSEDFQLQIDGETQTDPTEILRFLSPVAIEYQDGYRGGIVDFIRSWDFMYSNYGQFEQYNYTDYLYMDYTFDNGTDYIDVVIDYNLATGLLDYLYFYYQDYETLDSVYYDIWINETNIPFEDDYPYDEDPNYDDPIDLGISEMRFYDGLSEGMKFSWNATIEDPTGALEVPFVEGNSIEVEILQDSPVINNVSEDDLISNFNLKYNGSDADDFIFDIFIFILPLHTYLQNGTELDNAMFIQYFLLEYEGTDMQTTSDGDEISFSYRYEHESWEFIYDKTTGVLQKLSFQYDDGEGHYEEILITIVDDALTGSNSNEVPSLAIPISVYQIVIGLIAIPLVRMKFRGKT